MSAGVVLIFQAVPAHCFIGLLLFAAAALQLAIILIAEQIAPRNRKWNVCSDPQKYSHAAHMVVSQAGAAAGTAAAITIAQLLSAVMPDKMTLWPAQQSFLAQLALALFIYEFGAYWVHRAYHELPWLWPLHALHHSTDSMNVFVTGRVHVLSSFVNRSLLLAPLYLAGAEAEIFATIAALSLWSANLSHANVRMRFPRAFAAIVTTNLTHHLHHDRDVAISNGNYGSALLIFDWAFGTYIPYTIKKTVDIGVHADPVARNFWLELLAPLIWPLLIWRLRRHRGERAV